MREILPPGDDGMVPDNTSGTVFIRIAVTELKVQKCLQFQLEETVWHAKQRVLTAFSKDLRDPINYGLYIPPANGKAGKFMEEERVLSEYPLQGPIGFLEFKYKRRVFKMMNVNERKLKQMNSKSKLKLFLEAVRAGHGEKISKMAAKGVDPNFHDQDNGVTLGKSKCREVIMSLISGGSHLDFRNRQGLTALHRAAIVGNSEAIRSLLDLGASPDTKDARDLTPLYYSVSNDDRVQECTHMLLHERARVGICDEHGWYEIHQVCKYGRVQHLEHLLFYGAEMDVRNSCGNTPLHVCALNNQESCARVLLFRGADPSLLNYNNQTAHQVALMAGNSTLADTINTHNLDDVVPYREIPQYSNRRKMGSLTPSLRALIRCRSDPRLNLTDLNSSWESSSPSPLHGTLRSRQHMGNGHAHQVHYGEYNSDSACSVSISSYGSGPSRSKVTYFGSDPFTVYMSKLGALMLVPKSNVYVCTEAFKARWQGELSLEEGDIVEVTGVSDVGMYEGRKLGGQEGHFPSGHLAQMRMRRAGSLGDVNVVSRGTIQRNTLATLVHVDRTITVPDTFSPRWDKSDALPYKSQSLSRHHSDGFSHSHTRYRPRSQTPTRANSDADANSRQGPVLIRQNHKSYQAVEYAKPRLSRRELAYAVGHEDEHGNIIMMSDNSRVYGGSTHVVRRSVSAAPELQRVREWLKRNDFSQCHDEPDGRSDMATNFKASMRRNSVTAEQMTQSRRMPMKAKNDIAFNSVKSQPPNSVESSSKAVIKSPLLALPSDLRSSSASHFGTLTKGVGSSLQGDDQGFLDVQQTSEGAETNTREQANSYTSHILNRAEPETNIDERSATFTGPQNSNAPTQHAGDARRTHGMSSNNPAEGASLKNRISIDDDFQRKIDSIFMSSLSSGPSSANNMKEQKSFICQNSQNTTTNNNGSTHPGTKNTLSNHNEKEVTSSESKTEYKPEQIKGTSDTKSDAVDFMTELRGRLAVRSISTDSTKNTQRDYRGNEMSCLITRLAGNNTKSVVCQSDTYSEVSSSGFQPLIASTPPLKRLPPEYPGTDIVEKYNNNNNNSNLNVLSLTNTANHDRGLAAQTTSCSQTENDAGGIQSGITTDHFFASTPNHRPADSLSQAIYQSDSKSHSTGVNQTQGTEDQQKRDSNHLTRQIDIQDRVTPPSQHELEVCKATHFLDAEKEYKGFSGEKTSVAQYGSVGGNTEKAATALTESCALDRNKLDHSDKNWVATKNRIGVALKSELLSEYNKRKADLNNYQSRAFCSEREEGESFNFKGDRQKTSQLANVQVEIGGSGRDSQIDKAGEKKTVTNAKAALVATPRAPALGQREPAPLFSSLSTGDTGPAATAQVGKRDGACTESGSGSNNTATTTTTTTTATTTALHSDSLTSLSPPNRLGEVENENVVNEKQCGFQCVRSPPLPLDNACCYYSCSSSTHASRGVLEVNGDDKDDDNGVNDKKNERCGRRVLKGGVSALYATGQQQQRRHSLLHWSRQQNAQPQHNTNSASGQSVTTCVSPLNENATCTCTTNASSSSDCTTFTSCSKCDRLKGPRAYRLTADKPNSPNLTVTRRSCDPVGSTLQVKEVSHTAHANSTTNNTDCTATFKWEDGITAISAGAQHFSDNQTLKQGSDVCSNKYQCSDKRACSSVDNNFSVTGNDDFVGSWYCDVDGSNSRPSLHRRKDWKDIGRGEVGEKGGPVSEDLQDRGRPVLNQHKSHSSVPEAAALVLCQHGVAISDSCVSHDSVIRPGSEQCDNRDSLSSVLYHNIHQGGGGEHTTDSSLVCLDSYSVRSSAHQHADPSPSHHSDTSTTRNPSCSSLGQVSEEASLSRTVASTKSLRGSNGIDSGLGLEDTEPSEAEVPAPHYHHPQQQQQHYHGYSDRFDFEEVCSDFREVNGDYKAYYCQDNYSEKGVQSGYNVVTKTATTTAPTTSRQGTVSVPEICLFDDLGFKIYEDDFNVYDDDSDDDGDSILSPRHRSLEHLAWHDNSPVTNLFPLNTPRARADKSLTGNRLFVEEALWSLDIDKRINELSNQTLSNNKSSKLGESGVYRALSFNSGSFLDLSKYPVSETYYDLAQSPRSQHSSVLGHQTIATPRNGKEKVRKVKFFIPKRSQSLRVYEPENSPRSQHGATSARSNMVLGQRNRKEAYTPSLTPPSKRRSVEPNNSLFRSKALFSSTPSLFSKSSVEEKFWKKEMKREKEEKKRMEEERKKIEKEIKKEEKLRKKMEKKTATVTARTLSRDWTFVNRPIEAVYARPQMRLQAVPIDYHDDPRIPPPHQPPPPPPGHHYASSSLAVRGGRTPATSIYASTPELSRVEQVYGTLHRYHLPPRAGVAGVHYAAPIGSYTTAAPTRPQIIPAGYESVYPTRRREQLPRVVLLHRSAEGYGFVLRGAKSKMPTGAGFNDFTPTAEYPALQYLDSVDPGSQADRAGLKGGDFILEINGENVVRASHERVVHLIRSSSDVLTLKVVTVGPPETTPHVLNHAHMNSGAMTLPSRKSQAAPLPPQRDPRTSLSYSKGSSRSMAEGLAEIEKLDATIAEFDGPDQARRHSLHSLQFQDDQKVASVRQPHAANRLSILDYQEPQANVENRAHLGPAQARIKKHHKKSPPAIGRSSSTPDIAMESDPSGIAMGYGRGGKTAGEWNREQSVPPQTSMFSGALQASPSLDSSRMVAGLSVGTYRKNISVPSTPELPDRVPIHQDTPPGAPLTPEVVRIQPRSKDAIYANVSGDIRNRKKGMDSPYESSFRPGINAKLMDGSKPAPPPEQTILKGKKTTAPANMNDRNNVSFADDRVFENAKTFIDRHPNATLLVTADIHHGKTDENGEIGQKNLFEPEPDYDYSDDDLDHNNKRPIFRKSAVDVETANNAINQSRSSQVTQRHGSVTVISISNDNQQQGDTKVHSYPSTPSSLQYSPPGKMSGVTSPQQSVSSSRRSSGIVMGTPSQPSSAESSRRSSIQSNSSSDGRDSSRGMYGTSVVTITKGRKQEDLTRRSPPPPPPPANGPPPPPPPPPPPGTPGTPVLRSKVGDDSTRRVPNKSVSTLPNRVSTNDIMAAVAERQSRMEKGGPRLAEVKQILHTSKSSHELNQEALKAAVAKRMSRLQLSEDNSVVDEIEARLTRNKKLQAAKFFGDSNKKVKAVPTQEDAKSDTLSKPSSSPASETSAKTAITTTTTKTTAAAAVKQTEIEQTKPKAAPAKSASVPSSKPTEASSKNSSHSSLLDVKSRLKPIESKDSSTPVTIDTKKPVTASTVATAKASPSTKGQAPEPPTSKINSTKDERKSEERPQSTELGKQSSDYILLAEKARQEYLNKKASGKLPPPNVEKKGPVEITPNRKTSPRPKSTSSNPDTNTVSKPAQQVVNSNNVEGRKTQVSIRDRIKSFETDNVIQNGTNNVPLAGVTEDHSHTEKSLSNGTIKKARSNGAISPSSDEAVLAPPAEFGDGGRNVMIDIVPPPSYFSSDSDIPNNKRPDDSASFVSSVSSLSTLSSEHGEKSNMAIEDLIAPPPPPPPSEFMDTSLGDQEVFIPPPPEFVETGNNSTVDDNPIKPFADKAILSWSCQDVLDWLDSLAVPQYRVSFARACVDGAKLVKMGRNEFTSLGVTQVGHRIKLERSLKSLSETPSTNL